MAVNLAYIRKMISEREALPIVDHEVGRVTLFANNRLSLNNAVSGMLQTIENKNHAFAL